MKSTNYKDKLSQTQRKRILNRDDYKCQRCKSEYNLTVHHITPRIEGSKSQDKNLITLCEACHNWVEMYIDTPWDLLMLIPAKKSKSLYSGLTKDGLVFTTNSVAGFIKLTTHNSYEVI